MDIRSVSLRPWDGGDAKNHETAPDSGVPMLYVHTFNKHDILRGSFRKLLCQWLNARTVRGQLVPEA